MSLGFEWNDHKARTNLRKHGVDFVEAASVFSDPLARIFGDEEPKKERIRIISARSATRREQYDYEEDFTNQG